ncbi:MAG: double zinc ribbon domain-containing protein [Mycobacteriales bacterium]
MPASHCPACRAAVPVGAPWCGLCYADLRAVPAESMLGPPGPSGPGPQSRGDGWPCSGCGASVALDLPRCPGCGTGFLAELADPSTTGVGVLDRLARLATGNRLAALGIGLAGCGLFLLLWVVLGLLT